MKEQGLFDLSGRVAVLTGGSSGLGAQLAKALAGQGADIALLARRKDRLEDTAVKIREIGVKCLPVQCDVTDTQSIKAAVESIKKEYGKADILVLSAGSGTTGALVDMTDETWHETISVDLDGIFKTSREFGKLMIENNYGRIITIASIYGMVGNMVLPTAAYHAAKGGVVNFTRAMAAEWAKHNITANAICPGFFETDLTKAAINTEFFSNYMNTSVPLGRYGKEGELNTAVLFLASDYSTYVNGVILPIDGGYTCV